MDAIQKALEDAEIQAHLDEYQALTPAQLRDMLYDEGQFTPPQAQDLPLQKALVSLLKQSAPAPQVPTPAPPAFLTAHGRRARPRRWRRLIVAAAIIATLLLSSAAAFAIHQYILYLNVQKTYTQPRTAPGPEAVTAAWCGIPVPTHIPPGFFMSDAVESDGMYFMSYANAGGQRFSIYLYRPEASIFIDTEAINAQSQFDLDGTTVYLVEKNGLCSLFWNIGPTVATLEYQAEDLELDEVKAVIKGMAS